jgi:hypothetical protein
MVPKPDRASSHVAFDSVDYAYLDPGVRQDDERRLLSCW